MAIDEGCRQSFLVDVWGSSKFRRIVVVVNKEGGKEERKHLCCLYMSGWCQLYLIIRSFVRVAFW